MDHLYFNEYVDSNIPYKFENYTSESRESKLYFKGLGDVNKNFRFAAFSTRQPYDDLFAEDTIRFISLSITQKLKGVHPDGKNIIIPNHTIQSVLESMYTNNNRMGNEVLVNMTINHIANSIRTEYETTEKNNKLSAWVTQYDVTTGLQRFSDVKLNNKKRTQYFMWKY